MSDTMLGALGWLQFRRLLQCIYHGVLLYQGYSCRQDIRLLCSKLGDQFGKFRTFFSQGNHPRTVMKSRFDELRMQHMQNLISTVLAPMCTYVAIVHLAHLESVEEYDVIWAIFHVITCFGVAAGCLLTSISPTPRRMDVAFVAFWLLYIGFTIAGTTTDPMRFLA
jgi:hypothetical protein